MSSIWITAPWSARVLIILRCLAYVLFVRTLSGCPGVTEPNQKCQNAFIWQANNVVIGLFKKSLKFFWIHFSLNDEKGLNLTICEIVKILENNP